MIGSILIWIAGAAALGAAGQYYFVATKQKGLFGARNSFYLSLVGVIAASTLLMVYILQHRFEYNYISSYSSRDLPTALLLTTFWAGQEGSFLLWTFFAAVIGFFLQRYTQRKGMEGQAMFVYSVMLAFLLLLVAVKSPFQYI